MIPEWELELKHLPLVILKIVSYVNLYMAKDLEWAPMSDDLCPIVGYFVEVVEER